MERWPWRPDSVLEEAIMMADDREKWDGTKPKIPGDSDEEKGSQEKKPGGKTDAFEGPSKDSEDAKHDGP